MISSAEYCFSKEAIAQLDYVLSDAMTIRGRDGDLVHEAFDGEGVRQQAQAAPPAGQEGQVGHPGDGFAVGDAVADARAAPESTLLVRLSA